MLLTLCWRFALLSLMAVGGANVVIPEIHRLVLNEHWMSVQEFAALFAVAQAAPGPNILIVALVGWRVAGVSGAVLSMLAMCLPSSVLSFHAARLWREHRQSPWLRTVKGALAPVSVGLIAASGWLLGQAAYRGLGSGLLCLAVALLAWRSKLHPLWWLAAGAVLGMLGVV